MDDPEGGFMEYIEEIQEQVILVGVQLDENDNVKESLDELEELADTAGAQTVGKIIQNRETVHPGTYIGKGKIEEIALLMEELGATGIVCDDELSPAQINNLEKELDCKIMDRTLIILRREPTQAREISRLSLHSCVTVRQGWSDFAIRSPDSEAVSVREDRVRKSWRWTDD